MCKCVCVCTYVHVWTKCGWTATSPQTVNLGLDLSQSSLLASSNCVSMETRGFTSSTIHRPSCVTPILFLSHKVLTLMCGPLCSVSVSKQTGLSMLRWDPAITMFCEWDLTLIKIIHSILRADSLWNVRVDLKNTPKSYPTLIIIYVDLCWANTFNSFKDLWLVSAIGVE